MIIPQQILFWGRRFFLYGSAFAIAIFLIIIAVGSYRPRVISPARVTEAAQLGLVSVRAPSATHIVLPELPSFAAPLSPTENATKKLANRIAQEVLLRNPNGPGLKELGQKLAIPKAEDLVGQFIADGVKNFRTQSLQPIIHDENLAITDADDAATLTDYLKKFFSILQQPSLRLPETLDASAIRAARQFYSTYIAETSKLVTPRPLVGIHKQYLSTLILTDRLLSLFENYDSDPVQAIAAASALRTVNTQFAAIYTDLGAFIIDRQLTFSL